MKLYRCEWPNGDVSFVQARNKADAIYMLDEVADAEPSFLHEVKRGFMVHFQPDMKADDADCAESAAGFGDEEYSYDEFPVCRWDLEGLGEECGESMPTRAVVRARQEDMRRWHEKAQKEWEELKRRSPNA